MEREIKFRVWNHGICKMYDVYGFNERQIQHKNTDGSLGGSFSFGKHNKKRFTLMQFTGLHDKNNKPIYEGDILKTKSPFGVDCILEVFEWRGTWSVRDGSDSNEGEEYLWNKHMASEIIGNMFEKFNLLKP